MSRVCSVIIPVLHEQTLINDVLEHTRQIGTGYNFEIIVVDGDPEGKTIENIKNETVKKIISLPGRSRQMNEGASHALGDMLIFLHADTKLPEDAFRLISTLMKENRYVGGAFDLGIESGKAIFRLMETYVSVRTRLTKIPYGDQAICIKRDIFKSMGGFKDIPLMEDVELMQRMKKLGYKIHIFPQKVKTSARRWENEGVLRCTLRNLFLITLYSMGVNPTILVKYYYRK
jgi:rSAM/selenodomain-associated transferase 2